MLKITVFVAALGICLLFICFFAGKSLSKSVALVLSNFVLGFGSMFLLNYLTPWTGFSLPVNGTALALSGVLGLPGTLLSAALQVL